MVTVLVHGNPECAAVWGPLQAALTERGVGDLVAVSPPGFGAPVPDGFDATPPGYVAWLVAELEAYDEPVDLVGHDWGSGHVFGVVADRTDLVRSFTLDCAALVHPRFDWHDMAQAWRTPEVGEQVVAMMTGGSVEDRTATYAGLGLPDDIARAMAAAADETMGACILSLYRGAPPEYMRALGDRVVAVADRPPAHVVIATDDSYVPAAMAAETAEALGAHTTTLEGQGHWWMTTAPEEAADAMVAFWAGLD